MIWKFGYMNYNLMQRDDFYRARGSNDRRYIFEFINDNYVCLSRGFIDVTDYKFLAENIVTLGVL